MVNRVYPGFLRVFAPFLGMFLQPSEGISQVPVVQLPEYFPAIVHGRQALEVLRQTANVPGMSISVGIDDSIVWSEGFGFADAEQLVPVTPGTQFRIASVSKLLTAAVVGKMVEQGCLDLDADVRKYVPSWPDKCYNISARQLAGHLGGIREYKTTDFTLKNIDGKRYRNAEAALSIFAEDTLIAPPGTRYNYTSLGYTLLEAALEGASGESFIQYMYQKVLEPLGMRATMPNHPDSTITQLTTLFSRDSRGGNKTIRNLRPTYKFAGGGYLSTAEDLVRFGMAHLRPGFLKPETLEMLFQTQFLNTGEPTGVGIGWVVGDQDPWGRRVFFHNGNQPGARPVLLIYPDHGVVIAITSNVTGVPEWIEGVAMCIADPFLRMKEGQKPVAGRQHADIAYVLDGEDMPSTGRITLLNTSEPASGFKGWMDTFPEVEEGVWPIADVISWAHETVALIATEKGLFPLRWHQNGNGGMEGRMTLFDGKRTKTINLGFSAP